MSEDDRRLAVQIVQFGGNTAFVMMVSKRIVCLVACTLIHCGIWQSVLADVTNAVIPYRTMDDLCQLANGVDTDKLKVHAIISSTNKTVHPSDITLLIQSAKETIPVQVGTNGQVLNFPHRKELSQENPPIVANQPKGTFRLGVSIQLPIPNELTWRYARLVDGVSEGNKMIKARAGLFSSLAPKAKGVIFIFPMALAGKASVTIKSSSGRKRFVADDNGIIKVGLEKSLFTENPEVQLSEKPRALLLDIE